jgi:hypothetical protein
MLFPLLPLLSFSQSAFWNGAPLILNLTVILATVAVVSVGLYFLYARWRDAKQKLANQKRVICNYIGDFSPEDDTNPNRPIAILRARDGGGHDCIVGNVELWKRLRHVTPELVQTIDMAHWVNALEKITRTGM